MSLYKSLLRPLLFFLFNAERAHSVALWWIPLLAGIFRLFRQPRYKKLESTIAGLNFASPVGLAAGFDKDAERFQYMPAFGFGSVEVGTVTPLPQDGNDKPRITRLPRDRAVINRMGFPSDGLAEVVERLRAVPRNAGPVGVNIGANKTSSNRIADYLRAYEAVADVADYVTVNVSSPNTPDLRELERGSGLKALIESIDVVIERHRVPVFVKVSPDLSDLETAETCEILLGSKISGVIVGNTTLQRPLDLSDPAAKEQGGLSGQPLKNYGLAALQRFHSHLRGRLPLVSVGGIESAEDVLQRVLAGASLVQIYTAFIYEGPLLVRRINRDLARMLQTNGCSSLNQLVGSGNAPRPAQVAPAPLVCTTRIAALAS